MHFIYHSKNGIVCFDMRIVTSLVMKTDTHTTHDVYNSFKLPNHTCLLEFTARKYFPDHTCLSVACVHDCAITSQFHFVAIWVQVPLSGKQSHQPTALCVPPLIFFACSSDCFASFCSETGLATSKCMSL